jgi:serine/threonine-protein kinase
MRSDSGTRAHIASTPGPVEARRQPVTPLAMFPDPDVPVQAGEVVGGRYVIDSLLATGGMGIVCLGKHTELEQPVAIKFLRETYARSESLVHRFLNEARAAATLKSENVVRVMDVGQLENGRPYLVMEHLEGTDLEAVLVKDGPFEINRAVDYVLEVCNALEEAHSRGIVHRDIKPENLFLANLGNGKQIVKVVDFGLAKRMDSTVRAFVTGPQDSMGSPCYMSPEQITAPQTVDARTDIWSLGVVLYRLLTFRLAFDGSTVLEVYARVLNAPYRPLHEVRPEVDRVLEGIVSRCLEKDADRRYQSISDLAGALNAYRANPPSLTPSIEPVSSDELPVVVPRRRSAFVRLVAIGALALGASFAAVWALGDHGGRTEARAVARDAVATALAHAQGPIAAALEDANVLLTPVTLPDEELTAEHYAPLVEPALGVVSRRPLVGRDGQATVTAERERNYSAAAEGAVIDEDEASRRQEAYRTFLERERLTPIKDAVDAAQSAPSSPQHDAAHDLKVPAPSFKAPPSIDDLKAP